MIVCRWHTLLHKRASGCFTFPGVRGAVKKKKKKTQSQSLKISKFPSFSHCNNSKQRLGVSSQDVFANGVFKGGGGEQCFTKDRENSRLDILLNMERMTADKMTD